MKNLYWVAFIVIAVLAVLGYFFVKVPQQVSSAKDYKNAMYLIDGDQVTLVNGISEVEAAPGSAEKVITKYFGNEVRKDLDGDGKEDVAFLVTQTTGGSGTFYYVVAAITRDEGVQGSDGYLLGDRIAPQTTESGDGRQVIVNYAIHAPGESFTTPPSKGESVWLLLDPQTLRWGIVDQNFSGDSNFIGAEGIAMQGPTCPVQKNPPDPQCADKPYVGKLEAIPNKKEQIEFSTDALGHFRVALPPDIYVIQTPATTALPHCSSTAFVVSPNKPATGVVVSCDTGIR